MKNFYLNFELYKEDNKTIDFIEELLKLEEVSTSDTKPIANIYIDCDGGENRMAAILYSFFKLSKFNYNFIVSGSLSSNALIILMALNPKYLTIMRQSYSIVHLSNYDIPIATLVLNDINHYSLNQYNDFNAYQQDLTDWEKENNQRSDYKGDTVEKDGIAVVQMTDKELKNPSKQQWGNHLAKPTPPKNERKRGNYAPYFLGGLAAADLYLTTRIQFVLFLNSQ